MPPPPVPHSLTLAELSHAYRRGLTVAAVAESVIERIAAAGDDRVWIARVDPGALRAAAAALDLRRAAGQAEGLPLFGVPFAVKDNIDVAGMPTTAACPAYAYAPERSATAVENLQAAGALLVGKTNLDQFATGLVGTRSPYGVARNPFDAAYVPGGSSSGSAVAVASGLASFALGTDTAGSGRVPAMCNNIVGLKPTRGLISAAGVVPACRSLDCVSIFALTVEDAMAALAAAGGFDPVDGFSRAAPAGYEPTASARPASFRFGVPRRDQMTFFGNGEVERIWGEAVARAEALGGTRVEIDYAPFQEAARLLYSGPWVAERTAAIAEFLDRQPEALWPVTRKILEGGRAYSAVDAFAALYRLQDLRRVTEAAWSRIDALLLPTAGTIYRVAEVDADPIALNANLGFYTNFMNLLDLCGIAVPAGFQANGLPAGVTLTAPAWREPQLAALASAMHRASGVTLGATGVTLPPEPDAAGRETIHPTVPVVVVGAHMSGLPLNREIATLGGQLRGRCRTAPVYRLYRLPGAPARPGLVRVNAGGTAIEAEIWDVPVAGFGAFVARIAPPLGIGTIALEDGTTVKGFLCEAAAVADARDISAFGGWRRYLEAEAAA